MFVAFKEAQKPQQQNQNIQQTSVSSYTFNSTQTPNF